MSSGIRTSRSKVIVSGMADAIMAGLEEYSTLATDDMKAAVTKAAKTVRKEIMSGAPGSGRYAKSWRAKKTREDSNSVSFTVHSTRYQIAHLLEKGHAKRGGGRVAGRPHIAPAEETGTEQLLEDIQKALGG